MPRELITIQVGQCGNQIGWRLWDILLREHAKYSHDGIYDEAMSSFFRNIDTRDSSDIGIGKSIRTLKARSVLVDMEEGVINQLLRSPIGELFDDKHLITTDVSGAGNNWAHGFHEYGTKYGDKIMDQVRRTTEACSSPQSFFLLHSLGGGTGSGVGTRLLSLLEDNFPELYRFSAAVFPSEDDDVITSPYNSLLSLDQLINHADCVLPLENQALMDICERQMGNKFKSSGNGSSNWDEAFSRDRRTSYGIRSNKSKSTAYDGMNDIAAQLLCNLTSSMRFEGDLNVDLNELCTNLVPFPRLHFLTASMAPIRLSVVSQRKRFQPRSMDQMFTDVLSPNNQLIKADPLHSKYLACGLFARGAVSVSDIRRNTDRLRDSIRLIHWNDEGFKIGMCSKPSLSQDKSLLCLSNNCGIRHTFSALRSRFVKLFRRKAHLHHYTEYMEEASMQQALENVDDLIRAYSHLDSSSTTPAEIGSARRIPAF
eukprot:TRINITY_DN543912_c0_g1_i1.p1 TRINITY_DN543912_c0_g1~~TRINITY_DN543912_c0_g1_i1.p1  ORF type:complete len:483 (+),score=95.02 TRINITY_DN543912_c0_g1_i1:179-1627(+)